MPIAPNTDFLGHMHSGAMFNFVEIPGGIICCTGANAEIMYPLVTHIKIKYLKPITEDFVSEFSIPAELID